MKLRYNSIRLHSVISHKIEVFIITANKKLKYHYETSGTVHHAIFPRLLQQQVYHNKLKITSIMYSKDFT